MREIYTLTVGPDYTIATADDIPSRYATITLDEWTGKTFEEFAEAMKRKGGKPFTYNVETWTLSGRTITEHTWERYR
jgi:hypothetical protein